MIGEQYSRLTILSNFIESKYVQVRCECGVEKLVRYYDLKSKITKSCGCLQQEARRKTAKKWGLARRYDR